MATSVELIKERLNIVDVVGQYVKLTKAGKSYKGLSPFKKEKTPSFHVSPDRGMYYDFSTNQGGDIFTFVEAMEGVDFQGALRILAERAGVELVSAPKTNRDVREREYGALEEATQFYETKLDENRDALDYLEGRGLTRATMRMFRLGFAPEGWTTLLDHLTAKRYAHAELERVGLVKRSDRKTHYDRFRSRIMFPIMDTAGRVIAFSGRIFGPAAAEKENAKYLNSPETDLFDKGRVLYGYHKAKHAIRTNDFSILVEGQMDLVLAHQAGYANTVAVSGTALTETHLELLARLSTNLCLALDADTAGVASMARAAELALPRGMDVKVVRIPHGKDPADCIKEDPAAWKSAVRDASHVVVFFIDHLDRTLAGKDMRTIELRARDTVLPLVATIKSPVDRAHFMHVFADHFNLSDEPVHEEVRSLMARRVPGPAQAGAPGPGVREVQPGARKGQRELLEEALASIVFHADTVGDPTLTSAEVEEASVTYGVPLSGVLARYSHERELLTMRSEFEFPHDTDLSDMFRERLRQYAILLLEEERVRLGRELRQAERAGKADEAEALLARFKTLAGALVELERKR